MELRPHQVKAIRDVNAAIADGERRIILQAPVAWGKSIFAAEMVQQMRAEGKRAMFVAPAISLIDQTVDKFYKYGLYDIGVLQANHPMTAPHRPIQVCSTQTLARRKFPPADMVLIDEMHVSFKFVYEWMKHPDWLDVPFIGLSATPWSPGLGKHWDKLIVAGTMASMTDGGWLKKIKYYAPIDIDVTGVKMIAGDYHEGQLATASREKTILANTVEQWIKLGEGRPTIAFCVDRAHARDMQKRFQACGIGCEYIDAHTEMQDREAIGRRLEAGEIKIVVSVGCLIVGLDWTFVSCILFSRKTRSKILWIQGIGRGLRLHDSHEDCILIDCAGNRKLGHPLDIHFDELDNGTQAERIARKQKEAVEKLPKECPSCHAIKPVGIHECPACGFAPLPPSRVSELDSDLEEVGRGGIVKKGKSKWENASAERKQAWYSSLQAIARDKGYKPNWADVNYKERFGNWPNHDKLETIQISGPVPEVSSWVKHRMIKYARSRAR